MKEFRKCSITIEFNTQLLSTNNTVIYADTNGVLAKYKTLKKCAYPSPWSGEKCKELNQTVLCNIGLLCLCPIEVIPVLFYVRFLGDVEHSTSTINVI